MFFRVIADVSQLVFLVLRRLGKLSICALFSRYLGRFPHFLQDDLRQYWAGW